MEFPIDNDLIDPLVEMSYKELVEAFNKSIEDISNNSKDSPTEISK